MRIRYGILFFTGTILLVYLSYLFLQKTDKGSNAWILLLILSGIAAIIFLLIFLLKDYIKRPPDRDDR